MAEEGSALDLEGFEKQLQSLFKNGCSGRAVQVDGKTFCSEFRTLVEEYTCHWQTPLPQLRIFEMALCYFVRGSFFFPVGCDDVHYMLSSLALSVFELLLFFEKNDFNQDPLKHFTVTFQECHKSLARHQNVHLLEVSNCLQDGGPWSNVTLQAILTQSTLPQTEVDRYISSQLPVLLELRIHYLLTCERVSEAMALAKCCSKHPTAGQHHFFLQVYLTWLHKTSQHDLLNNEVADLNGKDTVHIICNMESEEKDESLLALTRAFLSQQLRRGDMDHLCDLVFIWSKLHMRLHTSKQVLLQESHELMLSATNVNSIFPFIRVILEELGKDGFQFCVELCAKALQSCLPCDVLTKSLIYKTIACLFPNDLEMCRACALLLFFLEPTVEAYKMVFLLYTHPDQEYHADASPIGNHVRFETLQVLKKGLDFDPELWNLMALRASCLDLMSEKVESAALEEIMEDKWVPDFCTKYPTLHSSNFQQRTKVEHQAGAKKRQNKDDKNHLTTKRVKASSDKAAQSSVDHAVKKKGNLGSRAVKETSKESFRRSFWRIDKTEDSSEAYHRRITRLSEQKPAKRKIRKPRWLIEDSEMDNSTSRNKIRQNNTTRGQVKKNSWKTQHPNQNQPSLEKRLGSGPVKNNTKHKASGISRLTAKESEEHHKPSMDITKPAPPPEVILELSLPDNEVMGSFPEETFHRQRGHPQMLLYKSTVKVPIKSQPEKPVHRKEVVLRSRDESSFVQHLHCYARRPKGKGVVSNIQASVSTITRSSVQSSPPKVPPGDLCEKPVVEMKVTIASQSPEAASKLTQSHIEEMVSQTQATDKQTPIDDKASKNTPRKSSQKPSLAEVTQSLAAKISKLSPSAKISPSITKVSKVTDNITSQSHDPVATKAIPTAEESLVDRESKEKSDAVLTLSENNPVATKAILTAVESLVDRDDVQKLDSLFPLSEKESPTAKETLIDRDSEQKSDMLLPLSEKGINTTAQSISDNPKEIASPLYAATNREQHVANDAVHLEELNNESSCVLEFAANEVPAVDSKDLMTSRHDVTKDPTDTHPILLSYIQNGTGTFENTLTPEETSEPEVSSTNEQGNKDMCALTLRTEIVTELATEAKGLKELAKDYSNSEEVPSLLENPSNCPSIILSTSSPSVNEQAAPTTAGQEVREEELKMEDKAVATPGCSDPMDVPQESEQSESVLQELEESESVPQESEESESVLQELEESEIVPQESEESKLEYCCTLCNKVLKGQHVIAHAMLHYRKDECMFCGMLFKDDIWAMMHLSEHIEKLKKHENEAPETQGTCKVKTSAKAETSSMSSAPHRGRPRKPIISSRCLTPPGSTPSDHRKLRSKSKSNDDHSTQKQSQNMFNQWSGKRAVHKVNGHLIKGQDDEHEGTKSDTLNTRGMCPSKLSGENYHAEGPSDVSEGDLLQERGEVEKGSSTTPLNVGKEPQSSSSVKTEVTEPLLLPKTEIKTSGNLENTAEAQDRVWCPVEECTWYTIPTKSRVALLYHALDHHYGNVKPLELAFHVGKSQCDSCGRVVRSFLHYQHHVECHRLIPRHPCLHKDCGARFKTTNEMIRHSRKHDPLQAVCCLPECSKLFICRWALNLHEREHYTPKPNKAEVVKETDVMKGKTNCDMQLKNKSEGQKSKASKTSLPAKAVKRTQSFKAKCRLRGQAPENASIRKNIKTLLPASIKTKQKSKRSKMTNDAKDSKVINDLSNMEAPITSGTSTKKCRQVFKGKVVSKAHGHPTPSLIGTSSKVGKKHLIKSIKCHKRKGRPPGSVKLKSTKSEGKNVTDENSKLKSTKSAEIPVIDENLKSTKDEEKTVSGKKSKSTKSTKSKEKPVHDEKLKSAKSDGKLTSIKSKEQPVNEVKLKSTKSDEKSVTDEKLKSPKSKKKPVTDEKLKSTKLKENPVTDAKLKSIKSHEQFKLTKSKEKPVPEGKLKSTKSKEKPIADGELKSTKSDEKLKSTKTKKSVADGKLKSTKSKEKPVADAKFKSIKSDEKLKSSTSKEKPVTAGKLKSTKSDEKLKSTKSKEKQIADMKVKSTKSDKKLKSTKSKEKPVADVKSKSIKSDEKLKSSTSKEKSVTAGKLKSTKSDGKLKSRTSKEKPVSAGKLKSTKSDKKPVDDEKNPAPDKKAHESVIEEKPDQCMGEEIPIATEPSSDKSQKQTSDMSGDMEKEVSNIIEEVVYSQVTSSNDISEPAVEASSSNHTSPPTTSTAEETLALTSKEKPNKLPAAKKRCLSKDKNPSSTPTKKRKLQKVTSSNHTSPPTPPTAVETLKLTVKEKSKKLAVAKKQQTAVNKDEAIPSTSKRKKIQKVKNPSEPPKIKKKRPHKDPSTQLDFMQPTTPKDPAEAQQVTGFRKVAKSPADKAGKQSLKKKKCVNNQESSSNDISMQFVEARSSDHVSPPIATTPEETLALSAKEKPNKLSADKKHSSISTKKKKLQKVTSSNHTSPPTATTAGTLTLAAKEKPKKMAGAKKPRVPKDKNSPSTLTKIKKPQNITSPSEPQKIKRKPSKDPSIQREKVRKNPVKAIGEVNEAPLACSARSPDGQVFAMKLENYQVKEEEADAEPKKTPLLGKRPFTRPPPTAYLDERYTTMPKRRKVLTMFQHQSPVQAMSAAHSMPSPRQRCASCFISFSSMEELQTHQSEKKCSNLFGFDSDDEGN